jgi:hypothetical protein
LYSLCILENRETISAAKGHISGTDLQNLEYKILERNAIEIIIASVIFKKSTQSMKSYYSGCIVDQVCFHILKKGQ